MGPRRVDAHQAPPPDWNGRCLGSLAQQGHQVAAQGAWWHGSFALSPRSLTPLSVRPPVVSLPDRRYGLHLPHPRCWSRLGRLVGWIVLRRRRSSLLCSPRTFAHGAVAFSFLCLSGSHPSLSPSSPPSASTPSLTGWASPPLTTSTPRKTMSSPRFAPSARATTTSITSSPWTTATQSSGTR